MRSGGCERCRDVVRLTSRVSVAVRSISETVVHRFLEPKPTGNGEECGERKDRITVVFQML